MLKIYVARHGQNEDNAAGILNGHRDLPLTELGILQARKLAAGIQEAKLIFDATYTSPLVRAAHTAAIVCRDLQLPPPQIIPELIERNFGIMTGERVADIEKLCGADIVKADPITYFLSPEGAETFPALITRAGHALQKIHAMHSDGSILVVTHGDFGKMLYASYYGKTWTEVLMQFHFGNSELLLLAHDSLPEEAHVIRIEQHNH